MQTGTSGGKTDRNLLLAQSAAPKPKLLDQLRQAIRAGLYSKRTEKTCVDWINSFSFAIFRSSKKINVRIWPLTEVIMVR